MKKRNLFLMSIADILITAALVLSVWLTNYVIPQNGIKVSSNITSFQPIDNLLQPTAPAGSNTSNEYLGISTNQTSSPSNWKTKFASHFTDTVISTDTSYTSPDICIQLTSKSYNTGIVDHSNKGKHVAYGSNISYVLADIYVSDIKCLQTAFAQDMYGIGYTEKLSSMSARLKSVLAVNGDSYSNNRNANNGSIVRNGIIYRNKSSDAETCVLNWDGTMVIYGPGQLSQPTLIKQGAYQSWVFGPSLLDKDGNATKSFNTSDYILQSHPRTAIGYYEPGHYCLLVVDGRQKTSRGMYLSEMSALFHPLGCKAAYNLDGGHCSFMTKYNAAVNHPYKPDHQVQDGIFIVEASK